MHGNGTKEKNCAICSRVQRYAGQSYGRTRLKDIDNAFRKEILSGKSVGRCDFGMRDWIRDDIGPYVVGVNDCCEDFSPMS